MGGARYDEYASWYDERLQGERHPTDCVVCRAILDLDDGRSGVLIDVGCGGAAHRRALCRSGRVVFGFDISFEQVRIARQRLDAVVVGDGCRLPLPDGQVDAVNLTFVHTDVADPGALIGEAARILTPEGQLVLVGAHPCFNGPCFDRSRTGRSFSTPSTSRAAGIRMPPASGTACAAESASTTEPWRRSSTTFSRQA